MVKAYAATEPAGKLQPFEYQLTPIKPNETELRVEFCGICYSDLSMLNNDWGMTQFPFVPGHEVIGIVEKLGPQAKGLEMGQRVGVGWHAGSCMTCEWCLSGDHNLCAAGQGTIVGRHGGFADRIRVDATWAIPLPEGIDPESAGPLFCGGITVFNPIVQFGIKPTDRVGVVGIGGLGHMALRFLAAWGCEVSAFSSSPAKEAEAKSFGASHFVNSRDPQALQKVANSFDFIISTVNASLDWNAYVAALRPKGRLHLAGAVPEPAALEVFPLIGGQKSVSGSPVGSPANIARMLDFAARHHIAPTTETFPMQEVNAAIAKLKTGKARYRLVLKQ